MAKEYSHFIPAAPINPNYEDDKTYILIESLDQLKESFKKGMVVAWDTETTGLNPEHSDIVGFSYTLDGKTGYYCPVKHFDLALGKPALDLFYSFLKESKMSLLYNARFDIRIMEYSGYDMSFMYPKDPDGQYRPRFYDVMNQVWLSDTNIPLPSLKVSTLHFLGFQPPKFMDTLGSEQNFQYVPAKEAYRYACFAADTPIQTKHGLKLIKDLQPGKDFIKTSTGYHRLIEVLHQGVHSTIKVIPPFGLPFTCTPDHKFAVEQDGKLCWIKAEDLAYFPFHSIYHGGVSLNNVTEMAYPDTKYISNVCKIEPGEEQNVYDLSIEGEHNFFLQCGLIAHNCLDAINTFNLFKATFRFVSEAKMVSYLDNSCTYIIGQLEKTPLNMNTDYLIALRDKVYDHVLEIEQEIYSLAGHPFKIGSNRELTQVFIEQGIDTGEKTKAGDMKTGKELLANYLRNHPECVILDKIIEYKEQFKFYNSYLKTLVDIAKQQDTVPPRFSYKLQAVPCLTKNNLVLVKDKGLVSIAAVMEQDYIWTQYGYKRVLWNNSHKSKDLYHVTFTNSFYIEGTAHHPVLVNKGTPTDIKLEWAILSDLKVGEHVVINHHTPSLEKTEEGTFTQFIEYLGFLTSPLLLKDVAYIPEYMNTLKDFKQNSNQTFRILTEGIMNDSDAVMRLVSRSKPGDWVSYIKGLLYAVFETQIAQNWNTDFPNTRVFRIYSENSSMMIFLMGLFSFMGIQSTQHYNGVNFYLEFTSDQSLVLFKQLIVTEVNSQYLTNLFSNILDYYIEYEDTEVAEITKLPDEDTVYDIEVEDVHEYVANGIVTHNTGRYACKSKRCIVMTSAGLKKITDIKDGDLVDIGTGEFVSSRLLEMGEKSLYRLEYSNGLWDEVTEDHRLLVQENDGYVWKYVKDITEKDKLCTKYVRYRQFTRHDLAYIYGLYLGNGTYNSKYKSFRLCFGPHEYKRALDVYLIFINLGFHPSLWFQHDKRPDRKGVYIVGLNRDKECEDLSYILPVKDCDSKTKAIDFSFIRSPQIAESVLEGYFYTDGDRENGDLISTSKELIEGCMQLFSYVGLIPSLRKEIINEHTHAYRLGSIGVSLKYYFEGKSCRELGSLQAPKFIIKEIISREINDPYFKSIKRHIRQKGKCTLNLAYRLNEDYNLGLTLYGYIHLNKKEPIGVENTYTLQVYHPSHQYLSNSTISHNCVTGDTLIPTILGDIPIEELPLYEDGNEVYVDSCTTARFHTLYMGVKPVVEIHLDNGKKIKVTLDHRFMNTKTEWVYVNDLKVGDYLLSVIGKNITSTKIINIIPLKEPEPVWTLTVDHITHQYLSNSLISHNCGKDGKNTYFSPVNLQCLEENTLVKTDRGNIPIKNVTKDDLVWTGTRFVPCQPLGHKRKHCYKIKTLWGEIEASLEHRFFTLSHKTWEFEWHTLGECILYHYPLVRDPQEPGISFDELYNYRDYNKTKRNKKRELSLEEYKEYLDLYKDCKFDVITESPKEFWNTKMDVPHLIKTVYDLYVPEYNQFTANGYIVHNSLPKPKSVKCYGRKATQEEKDQHLDVLGWMFSPDHPEWSPGQVVEGMKQSLNVRSAFLPEHPENGDYIVSIDMSGEELRVVTNLFKEENWARVILNGGDLHHANSDAIFGKENYTKETRKKAKCVAGNCTVQTSLGKQCIKDLCKERILGEPIPINTFVYTPEKFCKAKYFIYNGVQKTLLFTFTDDSTLEVTPDHIVKSNAKLVKAEMLKVGDVIDTVVINKDLPNNKQIVSIKESESEVFDLTIENKTHLFYANGFVVHNCAAFGLLYGQEYRGFQQKFPEMTLDEAKEFMAKFKQAIPHIIHGQDRMIREAKRTGTCYSGFGRPRRVKYYLTSPDVKVNAFGVRTVKNNPIQATASDVLRIEFIRLWQNVFMKYPEIKFVCTIHDEINFSVPRKLADEVIPIMVKCMTVEMKDWMIPLDCSLSCGPALGNQFAMKYNFNTKEFEPDWEEDTRKPDQPKEPEKETINFQDPDAEKDLMDLLDEDDEKINVNKKEEEENIESIDSKMFEF